MSNFFFHFISYCFYICKIIIYKNISNLFCTNILYFSALYEIANIKNIFEIIPTLQDKNFSGRYSLIGQWKSLFRENLSLNLNAHPTGSHRIFSNSRPTSKPPSTPHFSWHYSSTSPFPPSFYPSKLCNKCILNN